MTEENKTQKEVKTSKKESRAKEIHHHYHNEKPRFNFGRFFFGFLILIFGLIFLASNLGILGFDWSFNWLQLWPLLVILAGLSLLSRGNWASNLIGVVVTLFVLAFVGLMLLPKIEYFEAFGLRYNSSSQKEEATPKNIIFEKGEGVSSLVLQVNTGAGKINVRGGSEKLVAGTFKSNFLNLITSSRVSGPIQLVGIRTQNYQHPMLSFVRRENQLDLNLNSQTPTRLYLDAGASEINLDLTTVLAEYTEINTGASSLVLELGDKVKQSEIKVGAGASSIKLVLPKTLGVRIVTSSGLSSNELEDFTEIDERTFQSKNFEQAENKVEIYLDLGVSSLKATWR